MVFGFSFKVLGRKIKIIVPEYCAKWEQIHFYGLFTVKLFSLLITRKE
jgi:hypothetical protein